MSVTAAAVFHIQTVCELTGGVSVLMRSPVLRCSQCEGRLHHLGKQRQLKGLNINIFPYPPSPRLPFLLPFCFLLPFPFLRSSLPLGLSITPFLLHLLLCHLCPFSSPSSSLFSPALFFSSHRPPAPQPGGRLAT